MIAFKTLPQKIRAILSIAIGSTIFDENTTNPNEIKLGWNRATMNNIKRKQTSNVFCHKAVNFYSKFLGSKILALLSSKSSASVSNTPVLSNKSLGIYFESYS